VAIGNALGDAEVDGDSSASTCVLDGMDVLPVGLNDNAFLSVYSQGPDLLQRWVAFGPIL
jgi:hypothetical protein